MINIDKIQERHACHGKVQTRASDDGHNNQHHCDYDT